MRQLQPTFGPAHWVAIWHQKIEIRDPSRQGAADQASSRPQGRWVLDRVVEGEAGWEWDYRHRPPGGEKPGKFAPFSRAVEKELA